MLEKIAAVIQEQLNTDTEITEQTSFDVINYLKEHGAEE